MSKLILALILIGATSASAKTARTRGQIPRSFEGNVQGFSGALQYSALTDYAENRSPRAYIQNLMGTVGYQMNENWSLEAALGLRAETIEGQIEKSKEQSYDEVLNPSTAFSLGYEAQLGRGNRIGLSLNAEPLWDTASRLEGYRGIVGVGGKWTSEFFSRRYVMSHGLDASELINTYATGSDLLANPDYFLTYKFANVFRLFGQTRFAYVFGAKVTRYMDDFIGYSYMNSFSLSQKLGRFSVILAYENGGFTDRGEISLWYINEYRRLARLAVNYTF